MYFNFTHYYDFTFERWILIEKERERREKKMEISSKATPLRIIGSVG